MAALALVLGIEALAGAVPVEIAAVSLVETVGRPLLVFVALDIEEEPVPPSRVVVELPGKGPDGEIAVAVLLVVLDGL